MQSKFNYFNWIPSKLIEKKTILSIECEGLWRQARKKIVLILLKINFMN